jgi:hypothetical protein
MKIKAESPGANFTPKNQAKALFEIYPKKNPPAIQYWRRDFACRDYLAMQMAKNSKTKPIIAVVLISEHGGLSIPFFQIPC